MKRITYKAYFKRLGLLIVLLSLVTLCMGGKADGSQHQEYRNPNIIIILADDMGYGDIHAFYSKSEIPTPNLDELAEEGMMFTDAHTPSSVCTPTRYGLLTGRYCWRTSLKSGVLKGYDTPLIKEDRITIADYLNERGYFTGIVGKWHLGLEYQEIAPGEDGVHDKFDLTKPLLITPNNYGFDYSFVLPASLDFEPYLYVRNYDVVDTEFERVPTTEFPHFWREGIKSKSLEFDQVLDDLLVEAKAFINRASKSKEPFFLYFPLTAPHKPVIPRDPFVGVSGRGLYGDFITQIDWTTGEILKLLEELDLEGNTLVIFTSDNGSPKYTKNSATYPDHVTDETLDYYNENNHQANGYLRGIKGDVYEGGHRVPFIARWPAKVPKGRKTSETICLTDIYETIVEITGGVKPNGNAEDSYSFAAQLFGKKEKRIRPPVIHQSGGAGMYAIRKDHWKLIFGNGSGARTKPVGKPFQEPYQLYNLDHDLAETNNLIAQAPEIAEQLEIEFDAIRGSDQSTVKNRSVFNFPPYASPQRVGKLVTENLLSRDYMLRADKSGIHYAEICTADGAITFADLIKDTDLSLRLEERYACFLNTECSLIPPCKTYNTKSTEILSLKVVAKMGSDHL